MPSKTDQYIDIETSITLPIPGQKFGMLKPTVRYSGININEPIEPQLERFRTVALQVAADAETTLAQMIADMTGLTVEGVGITADVKNLQAKFTDLTRTVNAHSKALTPPPATT